MHWSLILLIGAIVVGFVIFLYYSKATKKNADTYQLVEEDVDRLGEYGTGREINLLVQNGYVKHKLVGMSFLNIPFHKVGEFRGYAEAQTGGIENGDTIAVYNEEGVQMGFIARGYKELYDYILTKGGTVDAYGYLASMEINTDFYGEICIEFKALQTQEHRLLKEDRK